VQAPVFPIKLLPRVERPMEEGGARTPIWGLRNPMLAAMAGRVQSCPTRRCIRATGCRRGTTLANRLGRPDQAELAGLHPFVDFWMIASDACCGANGPGRPAAPPGPASSDRALILVAPAVRRNSSQFDLRGIFGSTSERRGAAPPRGNVFVIVETTDETKATRRYTSSLRVQSWCDREARLVHA
jgi:hypothetical protein